jgi:hypothetical protein
VGDKYKAEGRVLDALRMFWIAPDHKKSAEVIAQLSGLIQNVLSEEAPIQETAFPNGEEGREVSDD